MIPSVTNTLTNAMAEIGFKVPSAPWKMTYADQMVLSKFSLKNFEVSVKMRERLKMRIFQSIMDDMLEADEMAAMRELVAEELAPSVYVHKVPMILADYMVGTWQRQDLPNGMGSLEWQLMEGFVRARRPGNPTLGKTMLEFAPTMYYRLDLQHPGEPLIMVAKLVAR